MADKWERAAKSFREAIETYRRIHRPDYQIIARTAWDEEMNAPATRYVLNGYDGWCGFPDADRLIASLMRDPAFISAGKR